MNEGRADVILASIREHGGRASTARRLIIEALLASGRHITVEDLAGAVQAEHPDIHLTTVYRTVEALQALGVVYHVHMGHGPAQWHLADQSHLHLVCQACGSVVEAPPTVLTGMATGLAELGFVPDPRHFALVGWCATCRDRTASGMAAQDARSS
ncbi:MAG TPA: transcriptional repressor [Acidimicrobiales bacterium]|nr:transcriptional repressor [Acidimicrobiales bacterium]